jgi:hypothetical protein
LELILDKWQLMIELWVFIGREFIEFLACPAKPLVTSFSPLFLLQNILLYSFACRRRFVIF